MGREAKRFERVCSVSADGQKRPAYQITCSKCGHTAHLFVSNGKGVLPAQVVGNKFRQRGWSVGATSRRDVCSKCTAASGNKQEARIMTIAQAPSEPSRDDRRRVSEALDEHYDLKRRRYVGAWNDQKLAEHLDVPRRWVEEVRDLFFGEAGSEAIEGALEEMAKLRADANRLETEILKASEQLDQIRSALGRLENLIEKAAA